MRSIALQVLFVLALFTLIGVSAARAQVADSSTAFINVSLVNQNPDPALAGDMVELRFMAENTGGRELNNIVFELLPQYPFTAVPGEDYVRTISTLSAYQKGSDAAIIKFKVRVDKDAVKGSNVIRLKRSDSASGVTITDDFSVEVTGTEFAQIIYIDKAKLEPGKETPLTFRLTNVGNSPLQNLVFSWNEKGGVILPVFSDDTKYIKSIDVGKSVDLEYTVVADVNAMPGLYQIDLNLKYEARSGTQEMATKAGIFIGGETDFDVTFSESTGGQTSLSVANTGNNPAMSVTVRIPDQTNYRVSGSASSIVGNLDRGDYTIVSFQISQATAARALTGVQSPEAFRNMTREQRQSLLGQSPQGNVSQNGNLDVLIEYTDTTGARHVLDKSVPIQFRSSDTTASLGTGYRQSQGSSNLIYEIATIVAIAAIAIVCYKKRKAIRARLGRGRNKK